MEAETWTIADLFEAADEDRKGFLVAADFERILKNAGKTVAYPEDIAHLLRLYDPTHGGGPMAPNSHINFQDFQHQLMLKTELNI